jgi:hypothetical protein
MIGDSTGTTGFQYFLDALVPPSSGSSGGSSPRLSWGKVYLHHSSFMLAPEGRKNPIPGSFDANNLWFRNIDALISEFDIHRDSIEMRIEHLRTQEHGGLSLAELSGKFRYCSKEISLKQFELIAGKGRLAGDLRMRYDSIADFDDFFNRVKWNVHLKQSNIPWAHLGLFIPQLRNFPGQIQLRGNIDGTLNHLKSKNLVLSTGRSTRIKMQVELKNLEQIENLDLQLSAPEIQSSYADVLQLPITELAGEPVEIPELLKSAGIVRLQLSVNGSLNDFQTELNGQTD